MPPNPGRISRGDVLVAVGLLLLQLASFWALEVSHPGFFLQDDNRFAALPLMIHNWRSLAAGEFPFFNFHQFLGIPHFSQPLSGVLYFPMYACLGLSHLLFSHFFYAMDVFVIFHLAVGSIGFFLLLRLFQLRPAAAAMAALAYPWGGFTIQVGASWYFTAGLACFFPFILREAFLLRWRGGGGAVLGLAILRAMLFLIGYVQFFGHALIFEFLCLFLWEGLNRQEPMTERSPFLWRYGFSLLLTLALVLPAFLPMMNQIGHSFNRSRPLPYQEFAQLAMSVPSILTGIFTPFHDGYYSFPPWAWFGRAASYLSHIGLIFPFGALYAFGHLLRRKTPGVTSAIAWIALLMMVLTLLWATNLIGPLIFHLPILNRFRWPFKLCWFFNFFHLVLGAIGCHWILGEFCSSRRRTLLASTFVMAGVILNMAFFHMAPGPRSFRNTPEPLPLQEHHLALLRSGRIFSCGFARFNALTHHSLGFNYALLHGLDHFAGYDMLIPEANHTACLRLNYDASFAGENIPVEQLRQWNVEWYVVDPGRPELLNRLTTMGMVEVVDETPQRKIFRDPNALPRVFWEHSNSATGITWQQTAGKVRIQTENSVGGLMILGYVCNPGYSLFLDGKPMALQKDPFQRIVLQVPPGKHQISLEYSEPRLGAGVVGMLLLLGFSWWFQGKWR
jgi:hypothetical protein